MRRGYSLAVEIYRRRGETRVVRNLLSSLHGRRRGAVQVPIGSVYYPWAYAAYVRYYPTYSRKLPSTLPLNLMTHLVLSTPPATSN